MIIIPNKEKPIFICTYDVNDQAGTYKTKVINEKNEEILREYDRYEAIDNYDSKQNIWYEDNVLRVNEGGKYGLVNFNGDALLPCEYDEITALKGVTANLLVKKGGQVGLVNEKGQEIIPTSYKNILTLKEGYKNEYVIVNKDNKYGLIGTSGTVILEPKYESIKYINSSDTYAVSESGKVKLVDNSGEVIFDKEYNDITNYKGEEIIVVKDKKYGVVGKDNKVKIPVTYEELKYAFSIYYIAKKDGKYGVIDSSNKEVVEFKYTSMSYVAIESEQFIEADVSNSETVIFDTNLAKKATRTDIRNKSKQRIYKNA